MALDLETINDTFFNGYADTTPHGQVGESLKGWFVPFDQWPEAVKKGYRYDPEGAEKLLDEAGYPRGPDGIRFKIPYLHALHMDTNYFETAIAYWNQIGVDVEMQIPASGAELSAIINQSTHEALHWWIAGAHYFGEFHVSQWGTGAFRNPAAVSDPRVDAMIDALRATTDLEEYQRVFREIDMYSVREHWVIWGPDSPQFQVSQPWIKGYNGEAHLGNHQGRAIFARFWIDSALKKEMGF